MLLLPYILASLLCISPILSAKLGSTKSDVNLSKYNKYPDIERYLKWINSSYDSVTLHRIGQTYENRSIYALVIDLKNDASLESTTNNPKQDYLVISGMHAREYVPITSTLLIIDRLINDEKLDSKERELLLKYRFHFISVANPDGYAYTTDVDRYFRKNRSPENCILKANETKCCRGVDLNRNFGYDFDAKSDSNACSHSFVGFRADSEPETQAIEKYASKIRPYIAVDVHSYGRFLLYPYAYHGFKLPPKMYYLRDKANEIADFIKKKYNVQYKVGTVEDIVGYGANGSALDYFYGQLGAKYSFAFEITNDGFQPDIKVIPNAAKELFDMLALI
uniref:Peptidase_M14 domain-containing protein n=1 Tax=Rhabditophanes sp. KR3021 TaxID=114890 RepID=A0AC35U014_9BILA